MKNILFLINPISGRKKNLCYLKQIEQLEQNSFNSNIIYWESKEQDIISDCKAELLKGYDIFAIVGGDGTINKMLPLLVETETPVLLLPAGSGNGLARHLKISMNIGKSLALINSEKIKTIDVCKVNETLFVITSGVGFDAHIGQLFSKTKKRGWFNYAKIVIKEFSKYKPQQYKIKVDEHEESIKAFLVTVANANQWGNCFYIAPKADISDGKFNISIIKPFKFFNSFGIALKLMTKKAHKSKFIETIEATKLTIQREKEDYAHYDGEPCLMGKEINFTIIPKSIRVIVP